MQRFEYLVLECRSGSIVVKENGEQVGQTSPLKGTLLWWHLNDRGSEGWELVTAVEAETTVIYTLKRLISGEASS